MEWYKLSRQWFDWCFENPDKIKPVHSAMYFFIIEHCNRLWWKEKFWLPMEMTKDAIGISNYRTYSNTLSDLIEWWFIKEIQKSKNQYSSTIIAIVENTEANTKALDKALQKHSQKQSISTVYSTVCIDKQETIEQETINHVSENTEDKEIQNTKLSDEWIALLEWEETFTSIMAQALIDIGWKPKETVQEFVEWVKKKMEVNKIEECEKDFYKLKSWLSWFVDHFKDKSTKNHKSTLWANFCLHFNLK